MSSSMPPVTPQRIARNALSHSSTPYTPLSARSSLTSASSTLNTPNSVSNSAGSRPKKLNFASPLSPDVSLLIKKNYNARMSDVADNWRARASNNGISVTPAKSAHGDSHYGDDEASDRTFSDANDSAFITTEEALLSPPSLGPQRRPRALSQAIQPTKRSFGSSPGNVLQPTSPNVPRTPARGFGRALASSASKAGFDGHNENFMDHDNRDTHARIRDIENAIMCTPPPNRAREQQLRLKGSFTDPAVMRRRPGFNLPAPTPDRTRHDVSSQSLFDIHEHEHECEDDDGGYAPFNQHEYEHESDGLSENGGQRYEDYDQQSHSSDLHEQIMEPSFAHSDSSAFPQQYQNQFTGENLSYMRRGGFSAYPGHNLPYSSLEMNLPGQNMAGLHGQFPIIDPLNPMLRGLAMDHFLAPSYTRYPSPLTYQHLPFPQVSSLHHPHFGSQTNPSRPRAVPRGNVSRGDVTNVLPGTSAEQEFHARYQSLSQQILGTSQKSSRAPSPLLGTSLSEDSRSVVSATASSKSSATPTQCSVCFRSAYPVGAIGTPKSSASLSLAILSPCDHPLCSACLTSALNIVGEKDMECAVCKQSVKSFELVSVGSDKLKKASSEGWSRRTHEGQAQDEIISEFERASPLGDHDNNQLHSTRSTPKKNRIDPKIDPNSDPYARGTSFLDPLFSSPGSVCSGPGSAALGSAFEFGPLCFKPDVLPHNLFGDVRASTPKSERATKAQFGARASGKVARQGVKRSDDNVVLRIDNVPWDITPPMIASWLEQPVVRVHVLLDRKGKTQSHAFVEVDHEDVARAVLRGEALSSEGGNKRMRSSVLGRGRRARGVTVTRSSQEELMHALFPSWRGVFTGSRPSLASLDNKHVVNTLESGLMTEAEIWSLLGLIKDPASHFLKVPCLPYYSVISILSKFPTDVDSRVFWTGTTRDMLYDLAVVALSSLRDRIVSKQDPKESHLAEADKVIFDELRRVAGGCHAFTAQQIAELANVIEVSPPVQSVASSDEVSTEHQSDSESRPSGATGEEPKPSTPQPTEPLQIDGVENREITTEDPATDTKPAGGVSTTADDPKASQEPKALEDLAKEFGVGPELLQAIAQRLNSQN